VRVELPGDGWAEVRGLEELKAKDRVAMQRAITFTPTPDGGMPEMTGEVSEASQMALLCSVITDWSLEPKPPVTRAVLEELPIRVYTTLCEATAEHMEVMRVSPNRKTPRG
jgi:hypothetical protein